MKPTAAIWKRVCFSALASAALVSAGGCNGKSAALANLSPGVVVEQAGMISLREHTARAVTSAPPKAMKGAGLIGALGGARVKVLKEGTYEILLPIPQLADAQIPISYAIVTTPGECAAEYRLRRRADAGEILGLQDILPESGKEPALLHIGNISTFVAIGAQRKGIGRALSHASFREARRRGYKKICAAIRTDNPGAISFYSSLGFETIGIAKKHALVDGKYIDEILMEKLLS